jgi:hypothetical protein
MYMAMYAYLNDECMYEHMFVFMYEWMNECTYAYLNDEVHNLESRTKSEHICTYVRLQR